jgi:predicted component of type VI protein secretion system
MKAKLIVVGGTTSATEVILRLPTVIGRGRSSQVTIPHSLVSRQHCEISVFEGRLVVRDLDSMNGTYIGDERITEAILDPGALLTVGTVTFRASYEVGCDGDVHSDEDSLHAGADDTVRVAPLIPEAGDSQGTELEPSADFETVPVSEGSFSEDLLPPRLPDTKEASDEKATQPISDHSDAPSLESAAKNSD